MDNVTTKIIILTLIFFLDKKTKYRIKNRKYTPMGPLEPNKKAANKPTIDKIEKIIFFSFNAKYVSIIVGSIIAYPKFIL